MLLAALLCAGTTGLGYMTTGGFIQNYTTNPAGPIALDRSTILMLVTISGLVWAAFTWFSACMSDKFGRKKVYIFGALLQLFAAFALFPLVGTGTYFGIGCGLFLLSMGAGFTHGVNAIVYTELFPASIRFSGISITYAIGSIIGGAFAPLVAAWLIGMTGTTTSVTIYLMVIASLALLAILLLKDRTGIPLGIDHEEEQSKSPFIWNK